ncbi:putative pentatricopeptide [Helianthus anomalus]
MIKAWELLHEWMKFGKVEAALYNVLLSGLAKEPDYKKINLLLKEMKEKRVISALAFIQGYPLVASGLKVIPLKWTGSEFNTVPFLEVKHWCA